MVKRLAICDSLNKGETQGKEDYALRYGLDKRTIIHYAYNGSTDTREIITRIQKCEDSIINNNPAQNSNFNDYNIQKEYKRK